MYIESHYIACIFCVLRIFAVITAMTLLKQEEGIVMCFLAVFGGKGGFFRENVVFFGFFWEL